MSNSCHRGEMAWICCKAHTYDEGAHYIGDMTWSHVIKVEKIKTRLRSMNQIASVKVKLSDDLAPMDRGNGEEQVKSRLMNLYGHVMI